MENSWKLWCLQDLDAVLLYKSSNIGHLYDMKKHNENIGVSLQPLL